MSYEKPKDVLFKVLELISYVDDKEIFTKNFFELSEQQALLTLIESLPNNKQRALVESLSKKSDIAQREQIIKQHFTAEELMEALGDTLANTFKDYIREIIPLLSNAQIEMLMSYLISISGDEKSPQN